MIKGEFWGIWGDWGGWGNPHYPRNPHYPHSGAVAWNKRNRAKQSELFSTLCKTNTR